MIIMFGNVFDNFFNGRRYLEDPHEKITISKEKYELLLEKANKLEALAAESKEIKARNQALSKEIEQLKEDGRKLKELEEQKQKYLESLVRAKADLENYKKISEREKQNYTTYATEKILRN